MKKTNFAWSCEMNEVKTTLTTFWTISHNCVKFSHVHAKSNCKFSLACCTNPSSGPCHTIMRNCTIWFLSSSLLLPLFSSFDFTLTTFNWLQIPIQTNYIVFFSHHPHYSPSSIPFLFCHSMHQYSPWNSLKTSDKSLVSLAKAKMY